MAEKKTVLLRINPKMWEEIDRWAEDEFRSINGQIEYILNDAISKRRKSRQSDNPTDDNSKNG